jgi:hypothetical protein
MQLIREALRGRDRDGVAISVKFGLLRAPDGQMVGIDGRPAAVKSALRVLATPPRDRSGRRIPPGTGGPRGSNRGDDRCDLGSSAGRIRSARGPVGNSGRDGPSGA